MIIRVNHPDISGNEKTYLTTAASASATTLTVQNIGGFSVGQYLVLGKIGEEQTEIVRIHTSTTPASSTITLNAAISFAHPINTPVTFISFNQVALYSSATKTGTYAIVGSATSIDADQDYTEISDSSGTSTTWYKSRYYNSSTTVWSSYSDLVSGVGYTTESLKKIIEKASTVTNDKQHKLLTEDEKIDIVNDGYEQAINRLEEADSKRFLKKGYVDVKNSVNAGTVSCVNESTTITGTGTAWNNLWSGKKILFGSEGFPYAISSVDNSAQLTLTSAYLGESALSGESYKLFQDEYTIYDESTSVAVADLKNIEKVVDKDGNVVFEYDLNRDEDGYFIKRDDDNLKLCLNFIPSTSDAEGRWTVWYTYQTPKLDSMADEPEFPKGYSSVLVSFLASKIEERKGDLVRAKYYMGEFVSDTNKMIGQSSTRTNQKRGFRLDVKMSRTSETDADWEADKYSRKTITGTSFT